LDVTGHNERTFTNLAGNEYEMLCRMECNNVGVITMYLGLFGNNWSLKIYTTVTEDKYHGADIDM
jgi:hypothetical protein